MLNYHKKYFAHGVFNLRMFLCIRDTKQTLNIQKYQHKINGIPKSSKLFWHPTYTEKQCSSQEVETKTELMLDLMLVSQVTCLHQTLDCLIVLQHCSTTAVHYSALLPPSAQPSAVSKLFCIYIRLQMHQ